MKQRIRESLLQRAVWTERATPAISILNLIARLHPQSSHFSLIRMGGPHDGGYLLPDDLDGIGACISPGVSDECSFDTEAAERGITVHMADASVEGPPKNNPRFQFSKLFFDTYSSDATVTLDDFCHDIVPGTDLLLQMDIEGAEYRVLNNASVGLLRRFRIMVIEFHELASLYTPFGFDQISRVFDKLLQTHVVVHIHPNNASPTVHMGKIGIPPVLEFTFHRRDRAQFYQKPLILPHELDGRNDLNVPDVPLPRIWYQ